MAGVSAIALILLTIQGMKCEEVFQMNRVSALEHRAIHGIIDREMKTRSLVECAVICHKSKQCETMRYNLTKSACVIIRNETQEVINVDGEFGQAFKYKKSDALSCCRQDGYLHIWELGICSKFNIEEKHMWLEAEKECEKQGGHLITYEYAVKEIILIPYLHAISEESGIHDIWWIGLSDIEQEGNFTWVTGQPLKAYDNWRKNQPDNNGVFFPEYSANCAASMFIGPRNAYFWHDRHCNNTFSYICEKEKCL